MSWPIPFTWSGGAFEPLPRFRRQCDAELVVGQTYTLEEILERSSKTHAHYFAQLHECWLSLPESSAGTYRSEEHFRKTGLIRTGFCDVTDFVASSKAEAIRIAAFIAAMDDYAIVEVRGNVVRRSTAKSQSYRAMDKHEFAASKEAMLAWAADQVGATPRELERAAA